MRCALLRRSFRTTIGPLCSSCAVAKTLFLIIARPNTAAVTVKRLVDCAIHLFHLDIIRICLQRRQVSDTRRSKRANDLQHASRISSALILPNAIAPMSQRTFVILTAAPLRQRTSANAIVKVTKENAEKGVRKTFIDCQTFLGRNCTSDNDCGNLPHACQAMTGICDCGSERIKLELFQRHFIFRRNLHNNAVLNRCRVRLSSRRLCLHQYHNRYRDTVQEFRRLQMSRGWHTCALPHVRLCIVITEICVNGGSPCTADTAPQVCGHAEYCLKTSAVATLNTTTPNHKCQQGDGNACACVCDV